MISRPVPPVGSPTLQSQPRWMVSSCATPLPNDLPVLLLRADFSSNIELPTRENPLLDVSELMLFLRSSCGLGACCEARAAVSALCRHSSQRAKTFGVTASRSSMILSRAKIWRKGRKGRGSSYRTSQRYFICRRYKLTIHKDHSLSQKSQ